MVWDKTLPPKPKNDQQNRNTSRVDFPPSQVKITMHYINNYGWFTITNKSIDGTRYFEGVVRLFQRRTALTRVQVVVITVIVIIAAVGAYFFAIKPTNNAGAPLALDGSGSNSGEDNATVSLTTTYANDTLYLSVATESNAAAPTIASTPILIWTQRAVATYTDGVRAYTFYAIATASGVISITVTNEDYNLAVVVFGVSGSDTASPFDTASASTANGVSNSASVSISTTNANDFVIGALGVSAGSSTTLTKDSSFTLILTQAYGITTNGARQTSDEYRIVSATGTYTPTYTLSAYFSWVMIADAIKKAP